jgi:calcineurin-like phosphoesterase family protein
MMKYWFTSDTHFGHARIIELCGRPFRDVQHMNETLVENWNAVVAPDDHVFHLGDVALGDIEDSLSNISRLNGVKHLVTGNHDRNFRGAKRSRGLEPDEWESRYRDAGFATVSHGVQFYGQLLGYAGGRPFMLSHFPYDGDSHGEERYREFRLVDDGLPLVHGHTHSSGDPVSFSRAGTLQIHVGVDAWDYAPVSDEKILEILRAN